MRRSITRPRSCRLCRRNFKPKTDKHWAVVRRVHEHSFRHLSRSFGTIQKTT